jgi:uncharacterized protein (DUF488 family)
MPRVYTVGYERRTPSAFLELLASAEVGLVIDVRETPWSHRPGFCKSQLVEALSSLGIAYVHARFAGNPKSIRASASSISDCLQKYARHLEADPSITRQLSALIQRALAEHRSPALLCYERQPHLCHRGELIRSLGSQYACIVTHLADEPYLADALA